MKINKKDVLDYWNDPNVESMYDKHLIDLEISLILENLTPNSKILDAGCGEGEGTLVYAKLENVTVHGADYSDTRLEKAKKRLIEVENVSFRKIDFLSDYQLDRDYDYIVTQRFLINLLNWENQRKVIVDLVDHLSPNGKLIMLEGSVEGTNELNELRQIYGMNPIPVKWHNLFLENNKVERLIKEKNLKLTKVSGLGEYFFLTRGIRPCFDKKLNWESSFNEKSALKHTRELISFRERFSRTKLWVIEKK